MFTNDQGRKNNVTPFNNDKYTDIMKTEALKNALTLGKYDFIYGGARRDEEASRSKEKVLSHRNKFHVWEPRNQRIEPWYLFNTNLIEDVELMSKQTIDKFGKIDALLNNAAGNFISPTEMLSQNAFKAVIDIVLMGTWNCTSVIGKEMIKNKMMSPVLPMYFSISNF